MAEKKTSEIEQGLVDSFRETSQAIAESIISAQQRNMKFAQSMLTNTMEALKSSAEATRSLMEQWEEQTQKQQEALQKLAKEIGDTGTQWVDNYRNLLRNGFSSFQEVIDATEKATQQRLEDFEKATEAFEKAAQQLPKTPGKQKSE